ncbi:MAG: DnaJ domain-containing protein [Acetatifactor sp.]|nr:DnaJ domain-containing protein [Acetatifactor sp.]
MSDWINIWETLGITYTSDISEIKRAYARRAKECHPEEHPEEFHRLQEAYKAALRLAKSSAMLVPQAAEEELSRPEIMKTVEVVEAEPKAFATADKERADIGNSEAVNPEAVNPEAVNSEPVNPESVNPEPPREELPTAAFQSAKEDEAPEFSKNYDFTEIREEEERQKEQALADFRKKLMRMIWNPYVRNNVEVWKFFIRRQKMDEFFQNPGYRAEFVRLMYEERFAGWHRDQIQFFHEYLMKFQTPKFPSLELQTEKWNWLLQHAETDRSLLTSPGTSEEKQNYYNISTQNKDLRSVIQGEPGQFWEERYLVWYLDYAGKNEDRLKNLYKDWVDRRKMRFEYGSVEQDFWKKFQYMAWNPHVRNDRKAWEYFFGLEGVKELFGISEFRAEFVQRVWQMCYVGWSRRQIDFFRQYIESRAGNSNAVTELHLEKWQWLDKNRVRSRLIRAKEISDYRDVYRRDLLKNSQLVNQYLTWYWDYARQNEDSLSVRCKHWDSVRKERVYESKLGTLSAYLLIIAFLIILLFVAFSLDSASDRTHWQQKLYEEMRQEWYEELNVHDGT